MLSAFVSSKTQICYLSWEEPLAVGVFSLKCIYTFVSTPMVLLALNRVSDFFEIQRTLHVVHGHLCDALYQLENEITDNVADGA